MSEESGNRPGGVATYLPPAISTAPATLPPNIAVSIGPQAGTRPPMYSAGILAMTEVQSNQLDLERDSSQSMYRIPTYSNATPPPRTNRPDFTLFDFGRQLEPHPSDTNAMLQFAELKVRRGFVAKVLSIMAAQYAWTIGFSCIFLYAPGVKFYVADTQYLFWIAWVLSVVCVMALTFASNLRRRYPVNFAMLMVFTVVESWMVSMIVCYYNSTYALISYGSTLGWFALVALFAMRARFDLTNKGIFLIVPLIIVVIFVLVAIFWLNPWWRLTIAALVAALFSVYMIYDVQLMTGSKAYSISPDDYVFASVSLFLDTVQFFLGFMTIISISTGNPTMINR